MMVQLMTQRHLKKITHEKIKIFHTENHGPAYARNTAIRNAGASIIMNLDADDKIAPELLEKAYRIFSEKPNVGIVHCDAECFGARSGKFEIGDYSLGSYVFENRINSHSHFSEKKTGKKWEDILMNLYMILKIGTSGCHSRIGTRS